MMPRPTRTAEDILADLRLLGRENDQLELRAALIRQNLKAAEARLNSGDSQPHLDRAARLLRRAG